MPKSAKQNIAPEIVKSNNDAPPVVSAGEVVNYRDSWRIFRIITEFVEGYQFLADLKKEVTILGSARIPSNNKYYKIAEELGYLLGKNEFTTITGGGPGIMEAANKGAFEKGGVSVGINMRLEKGERVNNYITKSIGFFFPFVRKLIITAPSEAFVYFPGGFGTLHQLFEMLTLQETKKIEPTATLLYGKEFWQPLIDIIHNLRHEFKTISQMDEESLKVINDPQDILQYLKK